MSTMDDERFDGLYLNVAQTTRGIEPLLDTVFSFLRRKTDFFAGPPGADDGSAAAIAKVNEVLQKHAQRYKTDKRIKENKNKKGTKKRTPKSSDSKSAVATNTNSKSTVTVTTQPFKKTEPDHDKEEIIEMSSDGGFDTSTPTESKKPVITPIRNISLKSPNEENPGPSVKTTETDTVTTTKTKDDGENDDDGPPPEGNGGIVPGKYVWTQTLAEIMVNITVPENTRGRDVQVTITRSHLKVSLKSKQIVIVDDDLTKPVICDDSFWTIEDGNRVVVNLQKLNQMEWWESICKGDPIINVRHIRPENSSVSDLDGETRKTVEKMMFDQRQKALGLPTSEEQTKLDTLEMFKKQHPEMDFANAKIS